MNNQGVNFQLPSGGQFSVAVDRPELSIFVLLAARDQITVDDLGDADITK
jgi:hypothetical protein